jgi:hypothetical protein
MPDDKQPDDDHIEPSQQENPPQEQWLGSVLQLRGLGRDLWKDEDPDEYVRRLREDWPHL